MFRKLLLLAFFNPLPLHAVTPPCRPVVAGFLAPALPALDADGLATCAERGRVLSAAFRGAPDLLPGLLARSGEATRAAKLSESVHVSGESSWGSLMPDVARHMTAATIESAAGTFGDPSRFIQTLPGVISDNDGRNDFLVRGGNPSENLFVIDGIVVPSINHLALSDTTGGFVSMLDNDAIESMTLHAGVHDAHFADRLSSVVEISTVPEGSVHPHRTLEAGLAGVGGVTSRALGDRGSVLVSGRQSVMNYMTSDIGMNGVPKYNNTLVRADRAFGERDRIWGVSLTGIDSIAIRPSANDTAETNPFDIDYKGWRNTTGANWQHLFSAQTFAVLTLSNAEQVQDVTQRDQLLDGAPTYTEHTQDGDTTASVNVSTEAASWLMVSGGATHAMNRIQYNIAQPVALPNPYSAATDSSGASVMQERFTTSSRGGFVQGTLRLPRQAMLTLGARAEHWAFGSHTSLTPRALLSIPVAGRRLNLGYAEYTQLPAFLYLLSFAENRSLAPIKAEHTTLDFDFIKTRSVKLAGSVYRKLYFNYPVASGFPQLSMANIADTFGQSFLMFPMRSAGRGRTAGAELSLQADAGRHVRLDLNASYARAWYSGLDGILRRGNYDIPLSVNASSVVKLAKQMQLSLRYGGASGRPYTPDDLAASVAQNRDVYDLARVNRGRSATYGRLDVRFEQTRHLGAGLMTWNLGLLNALNQQNFYNFQWQPRAGSQGPTEQDQMPRFPEGGVKYVF